jgi:hypothetical protein
MNLLLGTSPSGTKLNLKVDDETIAAASTDAPEGELAHSAVFHDSEMEHDFVSTILQDSESAADLAALHED